MSKKTLFGSILCCGLTAFIFFPGAAAAQEIEDAAARGPHCEQRCVARHNAELRECLRHRRDSEEFRDCVREAEHDFKHCLLHCRPHPTSP